jgi:hypothetical protein
MAVNEFAGGNPLAPMRDRLSEAKGGLPKDSRAHIQAPAALDWEESFPMERFTATELS